MSKSTANTSEAVPTLPPALRALLVEELTSGAAELPMLPDTAMQVLATVDDETYDATRLAGLIELDPSLAAHVLSVSNSEAYAPAEPIRDLRTAIGRLGHTTLRQMAVTIAVEGRVFDVPGYTKRVRHLWLHSAATALYSKEVARAVGASPDDLYLCGLLHDVGRPVVLQTLLDVSARRTERAVPRSLVEATMTELHGWVGKLLVHTWGLPADIGVVVAHHHEFERAGEHARTAAAIALADRLAHWAVTIGASERAFEPPEAEIAALGLGEVQLHALLGRRRAVLELAQAYL